MEINNIQNFQYYQNAYAFNHGAKHTSTHSAASTAIAGQFGVFGAKQAFGTFDPEKVNRSEKSTQLYRTNIARPKFLDLLAKVSPTEIQSVSTAQATSASVARNTANPYLSNFRGEIGQNMPLGENAIHENGGYTGANLNIIM